MHAGDFRAAARAAVAAAVAAGLDRHRAGRAARRERPARSATTSTGCASSATRSTRRAAPAGHYRLGVGAKLPPLLLDDEEAVAVAVGLRAGDRGQRASRRAARGRWPSWSRCCRTGCGARSTRSTDATSRGAGEHRHATSRTPRSTPTVLAADRAQRAIRDRGVAALRLPGRARALVEPYRLVSWQRRWYLVGAGSTSGDWRTLPGRLDDAADADAPAASPRGRCRARTTPTFVLRDVASTGWKVHARITVFAPAEEVLARINADRRGRRVGRRQHLRAGHRRRQPRDRSPSTSACSASTSTSRSRPSWSSTSRCLGAPLPASELLARDYPVVVSLRVAAVRGESGRGRTGRTRRSHD